MDGCGSPIPHAKDYTVTERGEVYSYKGVRPRLMKAAINSEGYKVVVLYKNNARRQYYVHRLVLETFVSPPPKGAHCRHLNGDRLDNRVENLSWGTPKENKLDSISHGTAIVGEEHKLSKLTEEQVIKIRGDKRTGLEIALEYSVSQSLISKIKRGKTWRHI